MNFYLDPHRPHINARNRQRICPVDSDILVRNLFAAQVAAESERQRPAA